MGNPNYFSFPLILSTSKGDIKIVPKAFNQFSTIKALRNETTFSTVTGGLSGKTIIKPIASIAVRVWLEPDDCVF